MFRRVCILLIWAFASYTLLADETQFSSDLLRQSVDVLHCKAQIDSLPNGSHIITTPDGRTLRVGKRYGRLVHLGFPLFSQAIYENHPPIYDFIEFAALDHVCRISDNPFIYKSLKIVEGSWNDLLQVNDNIPCTVNTQYGKSFVVKWEFAEDKNLVIEVPVEYDKLALMSRREIENLFLAEMRCYLAPYQASPWYADVENLTTNDSIVWIQPGSSYILPQINQNTYYLLEDSTYTLIWDIKYPNESLANIVNANSEELPSVTLNISFSRYASDADTYRIGLADFISFCETAGCTAYWGLEKLDGSMLTGSLYLNNSTSAYCHLVRVKADLSQPFNSSFRMEARASIFIPTNYVENLFQEYKPTDKKEKIKWK